VREDNLVSQIETAAAERSIPGLVPPDTWVNLLEIQLHLIDVTPAPAFAGLKGSHYGVLGGMKVLCCVLVFRRVAATDMAALEAKTKMHPAISTLEALLAAIRRTWRYIPDLIEMCAFCHAFIFALLHRF